MKDSILKTGELTLNTATRQAFLANKQINLPKMSYRFIEALIRSNGECVTTDELIDAVWEGKIIGDDTIAQRASLVRKSLASEGGIKVQYFETIRGEGYRWLLPVKEVTSGDNQTSTRKPSSVYLWALAVVFISITLLITSWYWFQEPESSLNSLPSASTQPNNMLDLHLQRASNYAKEFNSDSNKIAIDLYRQALEIEPENETALQGLALTSLHRVSKFNGDVSLLENANQLTQQLLKVNESNPYNIWLRGFYYDVNGDIVAAIESYEAALIRSPESSEVKGSLAYLYVQKGRLHEAMHLNIDTLGSVQEFQLLQIADVLRLAGLSEQAEEWYERAYQLAPDNALAAVGLARFHYLQKRYNNAETVIYTLHERGIQTADTHQLLALVNIAQENYTNALYELEKAKILKPGSLYTASWYSWLAAKHPNIKSFNNIAINLSDNDWPNLWVAGAIMSMAENDRFTAISRINRAEALGFLDYQFIETSVVFDDLSEMPGYQKAIDRMKIRAQAEQIKINKYALPKINDLIN